MELRSCLVRLAALLAKEFRQLLRDPRMRFFVIVPPMVQLVIFGFAATFDVREATIAVVGATETLEVRELLGAITADGRYHANHYLAMKDAVRALERGEVRAILRFEPDFGRDPVVQLVADGSDSNSAQLVVGQIIGHIRQRERIMGFRPAVTIQERTWYNPNLDDRHFFVPGVIANVVLIATLMLAAMTVVRERELGTLERLMVTPIARLEFLIAKLLPVGCVGLFDVVLVTGIAVAGFHIPFRGSFVALMLGSVLFLASTLGVGLLISSYSRTQQQAVLSAVFFIMPAVLLSGFAFPIENMPEGLQPITYIDPLRYFLVVIRDVFLKGAGVGEHLYEYAMMGLLGAAALGLSSLRVR